MNAKYKFARAILLGLVLLLSACTAPQAQVCPTAEPLSCPTAAKASCPTSAPFACPTASALVPRAENAWYKSLEMVSAGPNITITFDPGDKCSLSGDTWIIAGGLSYEIMVNDQAHQNYMVGIVTLDEGKTLKDLQAIPNTETYGAPEFAHIVAEDIVNPGSYSMHTLRVSDGPLFVTCLVVHTDIPKKIADLGPIDVIK